MFYFWLNTSLSGICKLHLSNYTFCVYLRPYSTWDVYFTTVFVFLEVFMPILHQVLHGTSDRTLSKLYIGHRCIHIYDDYIVFFLLALYKFKSIYVYCAQYALNMQIALLNLYHAYIECTINWLYSWADIRSKQDNIKSLVEWSIWIKSGPNSNAVADWSMITFGKHTIKINLYASCHQ